MDHDFSPTPNGTIGQNSNKIVEEERPTISVVIDEDDEGEEDDVVEEAANPKGSATEHYIHSSDKMSLIQISALNLDHNYVSGTSSREATAAASQGKGKFPVLHGLNIDDVDEQANTFPTLPKTYPVQRRPIKLSGYGHGPAAGDFYKQHLKGVLLGPPNRAVVSNLQQQHKQQQPQQRFSPRLLSSSSAAASSVGSGWHGHQQHAVSAAAPIVAPRIAPRGRPPGSGSRARQQSSATQPIYNSGIAPMVQQQQHFEEHLMTRRGEQQQQQQHRQQQQHNTFADVMEEEEMENEKFFLQQQQQMGGGPPLQSQQQQHSTTVLRGRRPKKQRDEEMFDTTSMSYQQHHHQQQQESSKPPDDPVPCQQNVVNHHQQLQQQQHNHHHHHHQQPYESSIDSAIDSVVRGDALVMQNFAPSSSSSSSACFGAATASSSSTLAQLFHSHTASSAPTITSSTSSSLTRQQQQQHSFVEHHSPPRHHQHAPTAAVAGGGMMTHHYPQYLHRHPMIPTVAKQSLSPPSQSLEDLADLAQASSSLLQQTTNSMLRTQPAAAAAVAAAAAASAYQQQPPLVQPVQKQQPTLHFKVVATNNQPENYPPKEYRQQVFTVQQQQQLDEEASKTTVVKKLTKKQMETIQCEFGELRPDGTAKENAGATTEPKQQQQQQQKRVRKSMETTAEAIKSADDGEDETRATDRPLRRSAGVGRPKRSAEIGQQMIKKKKRNWEGVDDYVTRCICGTRHTDPFMIECDQCDVWQHGVCMGVTKKTVPEQYFCEQCKPRELLLTASQAAAKQKAFLASLPPPSVGRRGRKKKLKLKQEQLQHKRMLGRRPAEPLSSTTQLGSVLRGNVQKRRGRPPKRRFPGAAVAGAVMAKISNTKSPSVTTSPTTAAAMGRTFDREAATAEMALRDNMLDDTSSVTALADKIVEGEQQQQLKELVVQTTPIENCYSRAVKVLMAQLPSGSRTHLALLQRLKNNAPLARQMYVAPNIEGLVATPGDLAKVETGTPLIEYNGMISLLSEVQSRTPSKLNQHNFTLIYKGLGESKELFVDACRVVSDARAVRKSCRPNAAVKHAILDGQIHIYLVATTDIDKSTEITIPFDSDYWDSCVPVECACGFSKNQSSSPGGMRCPVQEFNEALSSGDLASFEAKKMKRLTRSFGNTAGGGTARAEDGAATGGSSGQPQQQQQHTDHVDNNTKNRQLDKNIQPNDGGGGDMKTVVKVETPKAKKSEDGGGGAAGVKIIKMETLKKRKSDGGGSGGTKIKMETLKKRKSDGGSGDMKATFKLETPKKNKPHAEIPFHQLCAELGRILHKKLVDNAIVAEEFKLPAEFDALRAKCDKERAKKVQVEMKEEQQQQQQQKSLKRKATSKDADDNKEANLLPSVQPKKEKEEEKQQKLQQHGVEVEEEEEQKGTEADGIGLDQQQKDASESFVVQQTGAEMAPTVEHIASSSSSSAAVATTSTPESSARLPNTKALKKITIDEYKRKRMAEMAEKPALTKSSSTSAVKDRSSSQQQQSPPVAVRQSPRKSFFPIVVNVPSPPQQIEDFPSLSPPSGIGGRQQQQAVSAATSLSGGRMTKTTASTIDELKKRILGSRTGGGLPAPSGLPPLTPSSSSYLSAGAAGLSATSTVVAGASVAAEPQHPPLPDLAPAPPHKAQLQPRVSLEERLRARFGSGGRKK
uniref:SET domain-containing protein n=1 Tax=Globodera rostochiensis TaxID=31243 RepID=A0A914I6C5_GLORO